jgi:hypothetical protein
MSDMYPPPHMTGAQVSRWRLSRTFCFSKGTLTPPVRGPLVEGGSREYPKPMGQTFSRSGGGEGLFIQSQTKAANEEEQDGMERERESNFILL